jgi:predicted SAM-dependent methyltransferase
VGEVDYGRLREYLDGPEPAPNRPGRLGQLAGKLPRRTIPWLRQEITLAMLPLAKRKLEVTDPLRLHLGCGFHPIDGWVNLDLFGARADIYWDLRRGIPYPDAAADAVFHEHLLEHLPYRTGFAFTLECLRVLKPGGVLRIAVPSASMGIDRYVHDDPALVEQFPTRMMATAALLSGYGHQAMYDAETLIGFCLAAGFSSAHERQFGDSALHPAPDSAARRDESLYVEAVK